MHARTHTLINASTVPARRQLLRKFASLELENGEFRKKITLRDERIKQLEQVGGHAGRKLKEGQNLI